jgi:hypothetical protein
LKVNNTLSNCIYYIYIQLRRPDPSIVLLRRKNKKGVRKACLSRMQICARGAREHDQPMLLTAIQSHIGSLECYVERCGGCVVREPLPDVIQGELSRNRITLHAGLDPHEQLLALVHKLTHWLAHRSLAHARRSMNTRPKPWRVW